MPVRIQILFGSGVIQFWYDADPYMKEFSIDTDWGKMLCALVRDSEKYELYHASNSVEEYRRKA